MINTPTQTYHPNYDFVKTRGPRLRPLHTVPGRDPPLSARLVIEARQARLNQH